MPPNIRSLGIKACQAQYVPTPGECTILGKMLQPMYNWSPLTTYTPDPRHPIMQPWEFMTWLAEFITDRPLRAGLILDLFRSLPLDTTAIEDMRRASWAKEIGVCERPRPIHRVDFTPVFQLDHACYPIHNHLPANPPMNRYFYYMFKRWHDSVPDKVYYPRATSKFMSHSTRDHYNDILGGELPLPGISQRDYLFVEANFGISLRGEVEMTSTLANFLHMGLHSSGRRFQKHRRILQSTR